MKGKKTSEKTVSLTYKKLLSGVNKELYHNIISDLYDVVSVLSEEVF